MRTAVYPSKFNPITNGHLDIIRRASFIFDKVILAVIKDCNVKSVFSMEEKIGLIREAAKDLPKAEVKEFTGNLGEFLEENAVCAIIRGLRNAGDFQSELLTAAMNRKLAPHVETVTFIASPNHVFLNSEIINNIASFPGCLQDLVPQSVEKAYTAKNSQLS